MYVYGHDGEWLPLATWPLATGRSGLHLPGLPGQIPSHLGPRGAPRSPLWSPLPHEAVCVGHFGCRFRLLWPLATHTAHSETSSRRKVDEQQVEKKEGNETKEKYLKNWLKFLQRASGINYLLRLPLRFGKGNGNGNGSQHPQPQPQPRHGMARQPPKSGEGDEAAAAAAASKRQLMMRQRPAETEAKLNMITALGF